jgi:DNA-binding NarL/FixJ family response regulator
MKGGILALSREEKLYPSFMKRFAELGFKDIEISGQERDALNTIINDMKPRLVLVGSGYYKGSTPYMMGELLKGFPNLNMAAISVLCKIPDDLAMWFIFNGVRSYVNLFEGYEEFHRGLSMVRNGEAYISPNVIQRIDLRKEKPEPLRNLTPRHVEIVRLLCNGFTSFEIADVLNISRRTVDTHKTDLYTILAVRNENELIRAAIYLGLIDPEELVFFGGRYELNPKPEKTVDQKEKRRRYDVLAEKAKGDK